MQQLNINTLPYSITRMQHSLYSKYSSSQMYYFTNLINQIVKQKRTHANIMYQDLEYLQDNEQFLKRWYNQKQFNSKMFTFKEYYFYHEDCPRIFMKKIQDAYTRWQDKKRDLVYRKLKLIHNQQYDSSANSSDPSQNPNQNPPVQHFLLDISQYNPYSKNYYLRVQARKEKQLALQQQKLNKSKKQLSFLQHQLSFMLNDIHQLSVISTLIDSPKEHPYHSRKSSHAKNTLESSSSNTKSSIKLNFKKNKSKKLSYGNCQQSGSVQKYKKSERISKELWQKNNGQHLKLIQKDILHHRKISPKFVQPPPAQTIKTQSIFSVSSFGGLNKKITQIKLNPKRQTLKLNYDIKGKPRYQSQKPINFISKSNSISKFNKQPLEKIKIKQGSLKKKQRQDQFSDKKIINIDNKLRSHKSQFSSLGNLKKVQFKIKNNRISEQKNHKRVLELKNI